MNKGGFSFVAMLVINPIVILFYQNCSLTPASYAAKKSPPVIQRQVASTADAQPVVLAKEHKTCEKGKSLDCPTKKE